MRRLALDRLPTAGVRLGGNGVPVLPKLWHRAGGQPESQVQDHPGVDLQDVSSWWCGIRSARFVYWGMVEEEPLSESSNVHLYATVVYYVSLGCSVILLAIQYVPLGPHLQISSNIKFINSRNVTMCVFSVWGRRRISILLSCVTRSGTMYTGYGACTTWMWTIVLSRTSSLMVRRFVATQGASKRGQTWAAPGASKRGQTGASKRGRRKSIPLSHMKLLLLLQYVYLIPDPLQVSATLSPTQHVALRTWQRTRSTTGAANGARASLTLKRLVTRVPPGCHGNMSASYIPRIASHQGTQHA